MSPKTDQTDQTNQIELNKIKREIEIEESKPECYKNPSKLKWLKEELILVESRLIS